MNNLFKNWDSGRIIRLILSIALSIYAIVSKDYGFFFLAGLFLLQAVFNLSCCGAGGCASSGTDSQDQVFKGEIEEYKPGKK
jgi:hypothetical protein